MRIVAYILLFFLVIGLWISCRITKPIRIKDHDLDTTIYLKINPIDIDKPTTIHVEKKYQTDTIDRIFRFWMTPEKQRFQYFDTFSFNKNAQRYFTEYRKSFYNQEEESHSTERLALILQIRNLISERRAMADTITSLKNKCAKVETTAQATQSVIFDVPKLLILIVLAVLLFGTLRYYIYKRMLQNELRKKYTN